MKLSFDFEKYKNKLTGNNTEINKNEGVKAAPKTFKEAKQEELVIYQEMVKDYNFQVRDISAEIPSDLKVFSDKLKLGHYDQAIYPQGNNDRFFWDRVRAESGTPYEKWTHIQKLRKEYEDFLYNYNDFELFSKISNGKFNNLKNLIHSFYGYSGGGGFIVDRVKKKSSTSPDPVLLGSIDFEKMYGDGSVATPTRTLFFSSGGTENYISPLKELAIFSKENPNFEAFLIIESVLSAKRHGINIPPEYIDSVETIIKNKDKIVDFLSQQEKVTQDFLEAHEDNDLTVYNNASIYHKKLMDDPNFEFYSVFHSQKFTSLHYLLGHSVIADSVEGLEFIDAEEALKMLGKHLKKDSIKFIDIADTVIDLMDEKVYEYTGKKEM